MKAVLILGATSGIAREMARSFAKRGYDVTVAGRDAETLDTIAADLRIRYGVQSKALRFDVSDFSSHAVIIDQYFADAGQSAAGVCLCLGYLGDQATAQQDDAEAQQILQVNMTACVSLLEHAARHLETRRSGFVCALGSVAGDRGRRSNYLYGSAKAGLAAYLQGLRSRLFVVNVPVTTVKPGFVDTGMTFGKPGMFLVASPESVAEAVCAAVERKKDTVYLPKFWGLIMLIIKLVPETIFKRLPL